MRLRRSPLLLREGGRTQRPGRARSVGAHVLQAPCDGLRAEMSIRNGQCGGSISACSYFIYSNQPLSY
jgi:hypothetical protein